MACDTWVVLATGPSMSQAVAATVRGRASVVAVSDAWRLAPWADVLVSCDAAWWAAHPDALAFPGARLCCMPESMVPSGVERFPAEGGTNSALVAAMVAASRGAKRILLCGVDLHSPGDHFFGVHPAPLKRTTPERMRRFARQFGAYRPRGVEIINCTPGSSLDCYPRRELEDCLC